MAEALIAVRNTAPKWLKGASDATIRNRFWLSHLRKEGRIVFNHNGTGINWNVQAREPSVELLASGMGVEYKQHQAYESLLIPYAGMRATDALDYKVQLANRGELAIVDLYETKMQILLNTISRALHKGLYYQNTGNDDMIAGIRTPCVADGSTNANDRVAAPASTAAYGGKSSQLGAIGGTWSADMVSGDRPSSVLANDWPEGSGTSDYDWNSPLMLQYTANKWDGTGATWKANCEYVMRRGMAWIRHRCGETSVPDIYLLSVKLFSEFQDSLQTRERLFPSDYAKALGFPQGKYLEYNGSIVATDYDCPADKGYALNVSEMELCSMHDNLFFTEGPTFDHKTLSSDFLVGFYGNLRFNPRNVVEFGKYA
jgi:hypothetical protein